MSITASGICGECPTMSVDDAGTLTISVRSATTGSNLGQGEWYGQCSVIKKQLPESVKRMIQKKGSSRIGIVNRPVSQISSVG